MPILVLCYFLLAFRGSLIMIGRMIPYVRAFPQFCIALVAKSFGATMNKYVFVGRLPRQMSACD